MRHICEFDGIGYVNNRGTSRYWGVVSKTLTAGSTYFVCLNGPGGKVNIHNHLSEKENAWIAASYYEYPKEEYGVARAIPSPNGDREYRITANGKVHVHSTQYGTSTYNVKRVTGSPQPDILCGQQSKTDTDNKPEVLWSAQSIQALQELARVALEDDTTDGSYWETMERIARIAKSRPGQ